MLTEIHWPFSAEQTSTCAHSIVIACLLLGQPVDRAIRLIWLPPLVTGGRNFRYIMPSSRLNAALPTRKVCSYQHVGLLNEPRGLMAPGKAFRRRLAKGHIQLGHDVQSAQEYKAENSRSEEGLRNKPLPSSTNHKTMTTYLKSVWTTIKQWVPSSIPVIEFPQAHPTSSDPHRGENHRLTSRRQSVATPPVRHPRRS